MIGARFLSEWKGRAVPMEHRPATLEDLPLIAQFLQKHYPGRATRETIMRGAKWMAWCIQSPTRAVLIGPNSFAVASYDTHYGCERKARIDIICARAAPGSSLESLRLVRKLVSWARRHGCPTLRMDADNATDFGPFAKRLGARRIETVKYEIEVGHGG